jgi:branched-chain amino acid transport system substrate-binding protein
VIAAGCGSSNSGASGGTAAGTQGATKTGVVTIGGLESVTGAFAAGGQAILGGLKVAVADINGAGGFTVGDTRYTINLVTADAASDPAKATAGAIGLIRDNQVQFLFGPAETSGAIAVQAQTAPARVLWFTSSLTVSDTLDQQGVSSALNKYAFSELDGAKSQAKHNADGARANFPAAKSAVVMMVSSSSFDYYTGQLADSFRADGFAVPDGNVIRYDAATTDFGPLLTRVKAIHPDVLVVGVAAAAVTNVAKQMVALGDVAGALIGTIGGAAIAQSTAIGKPLPFPFQTIAVGGLNPAQPQPQYTDFLSRFQQVNGAAAPTSTASFSTSDYAPLEGLIAAMQKAGTTTDVDKVAAAIVQSKGTGPVGPVTWTANHAARTSTYICLVVAGTQTCAQK